MKQQKDTTNIKYLLTNRYFKQYKKVLYGMFIHKNTIYYIYQINEKDINNVSKKYLSYKTLKEIFKFFELIKEY